MLTINIDGSCEPTNPGGYACWAYTVSNWRNDEIAKGYGCLGYGEGMTNNIAEYHALLSALLRARIENWSGFTILSDSQLVVNQANYLWKCKSPVLLSYLKMVVPLIAEFKVKLKWVPREQNVRADELASIAYRQALLGVDTPMIGVPPGDD